MTKKVDHHAVLGDLVFYIININFISDLGIYNKIFIYVGYSSKGSGSGSLSDEALYEFQLFLIWLY
jgi:hypothetical protein